MPKVIYSGSVPDRSLTVLADGVKVQHLRHVRLSADYLQSLFRPPSACASGIPRRKPSTFSAAPGN